MSVVLQEIIAILVAGITTLGQGIGQGFLVKQQTFKGYPF